MGESFLDVIFIIAFIFVIFFQPVVKKKQDIPTLADVSARSFWDDKSKSDIDIWVRAPNGQLCGWTITHNSLMVLDDDDTGYSEYYNNDRLDSNSEQIKIQEVQDGWYNFNLHAFNINDSDGSEKVNLIIYDLEGNLLINKEITLTNKEQKTVVNIKFKDKKMIDHNFNQYKFFNYPREIQ